MQQNIFLKEDNSYQLITYELYKQYYKCNDIGNKSYILFKIFHNQICNDLKKRKVLIIPKGFIISYVWSVKYQYVMWLLNIKMTNWFDRIPLYKELISVVWHPRNFQKFPFLDPEIFDDFS